MSRNVADVFDRGVWLRSRLRAVRRVLLVLIAVGLFVEFLGLPELRLQAGRRGGYAIYYGVQGQRSFPAHGSRPLVVLRKLDRSLLDHAKDGLRGLRARKSTS